MPNHHLEAVLEAGSVVQIDLEVVLEVDLVVQTAPAVVLVVVQMTEVVPEVDLEVDLEVVRAAPEVDYNPAPAAVLYSLRVD